jgi:hypothetical protein
MNAFMAQNHFATIKANDASACLSVATWVDCVVMKTNVDCWPIAQCAVAVDLCWQARCESSNSILELDHSPSVLQQYKIDSAALDQTGYQPHSPSKALSVVVARHYNKQQSLLT